MDNTRDKSVLIHETWNITLTESAKGALVTNDIDFDTDEVLSSGEEKPHALYRIYVNEDDVEKATEVLEYAGCIDDSPWDPNSPDNNLVQTIKWYKNRRILRRIFWGVVIVVVLIYAIITFS